MNEKKFKANEKSIRKHETPLWFKNAKFGIFIH
ncbi:MAG: alpha-L-fucosidase [Promethearchaeota archaeon]